jgi:citrate synthase
VHGGANEAVLLMLKEIGFGRPRSGIHQARKGRERSIRLTGFGYRVYKHYDPRAKIMQTACQEVLDTLGRDHRDDPILKVALELERIALSDDYFVENNLVPTLTSIRRSR